MISCILIWLGCISIRFLLVYSVSLSSDNICVEICVYMNVALSLGQRYVQPTYCCSIYMNVALSLGHRYVRFRCRTPWILWFHLQDTGGMGKTIKFCKITVKNLLKQSCRIAHCIILQKIMMGYNLCTEKKIMRCKVKIQSPDTPRLNIS